MEKNKWEEQAKEKVKMFLYEHGETSQSELAIHLGCNYYRLKKLLESMETIKSRKEGVNRTYWSLR